MRLGISIDIVEAEKKLEEAAHVAHSELPVPFEWVSIATEVGLSSRKIDTVVLACALLAKSCDSRIDPLVVKLGVSARGYPMRAIAEKVLVKGRLRYGFDLGSTSPNPVNSSTFLKPRTLEEVVTRDPIGYQRFLNVLRTIDRLSSDEAALALAAWLRVRMEIASAKQTLRISTSNADLAEILHASHTFAIENPEGGARGQALVAAAFGIVWQDVRTGKINDPSRHWPGDVHAFNVNSEVPVAAVEVKQRVVDTGEVREFIQNCTDRGIYNVFFAALHPGQRPLTELRIDTIARQEGCLFTWISGIKTIVANAFAWSATDFDTSRLRFVQGMADRLAELELSNNTQQRWLELSKSST